MRGAANFLALNVAAREPDTFSRARACERVSLRALHASFFFLATVLVVPGATDGAGARLTRDGDGGACDGGPHTGCSVRRAA